MSEWININLPWCVHIHMDRPEYPQEIVDNLVRAKFGCTLEEMRERFLQKHGQEEYEVISEFRNSLRDKLFDENPDESSDAIEQKVKDAVASSEDPLIVEIKYLQNARKEINAFLETIPEVVAWSAESDRIYELERAEEKKSCFCESVLNRPGVMIEVQVTEDGEVEIQRHVIGTINRRAGVCNDCRAFENDAIVLRAKVLIPEDTVGMERRIRRVAKHLYEIRTACGTNTSNLQNWLDAERMVIAGIIIDDLLANTIPERRNKNKTMDLVWDEE